MNRKKIFFLLKWSLILLAACAIAVMVQRWKTSLTIDEFFRRIVCDSPQSLDLFLRDKKHIIFPRMRENKKYLNEANNPLILCANSKQNGKVGIILAHGYLQYCPEPTSRIMALFPDDCEVVEKLYLHGINPNAPDDDGEDYKHSLLVRLIGPFPIGHDDERDEERRKRLETIRFLIRSGVDVNVGSWQRYKSGAEETLTPLQWAAMTGNAELLKILLDAGADPHIPDVNGLTVAEKCFAYRKSFRSVEELNEILNLLRTPKKEK